MRIPQDAIVPREKLLQYLLIFKEKNDKSKFLAQAGFELDNPDTLEAAIRKLIRENDAVQDRSDDYGTFYRVNGELQGPEGVLSVVTIWLLALADANYRFITLKPDLE